MHAAKAVMFGRKETYRWGPRVIDVDILFYEDFILKSELLTIPLSSINLRTFLSTSVSFTGS